MRRIVLAMAIGVLAAAGLVAELRPDAPASAAGSSTGTVDPDRFAVDLRAALAPLLADLEPFESLLGDLGRGVTPGPDVGPSVQRWVADFGDARQRVARLVPPDGPWGTAARDLHETAVQLYGEAARALGGAAGKDAPPGDPPDLARSARRLTTLGDRLFDAGRRLQDGLSPDTGAVVVERILPPAVPDFAGDDLPPSGSADAAALDEITRRIGAAPALSGPAGEGIHALRLSLLVTSEARRVPDGAQAGRLRLVAERLAVIAVALLHGSGR
jgi:hypothetical protein